MGKKPTCKGRLFLAFSLHSSIMKSSFIEAEIKGETVLKPCRFCGNLLEDSSNWCPSCMQLQKDAVPQENAPLSPSSRRFSRKIRWAVLGSVFSTVAFLTAFFLLRAPFPVLRFALFPPPSKIPRRTLENFSSLLRANIRKIPSLLL